ncbi:6,7-dimethyl-8-ribityllumazine synthase [Lacibacterium aquatile]
MNQSSPLPINGRVAFIHGAWHLDIVGQCRDAFMATVPSLGLPAANVDIFEVPGAFEIPLQAKLLAKTGRYRAIVASAFVVDGGIYRHDFVADTVVSALMQVQLETEVPVMSAVLTPHHFHEHAVHSDFFKEHFVKKGQEAARACVQTIRSIGAIRTENFEAA